MVRHQIEHANMIKTMISCLRINQNMIAMLYISGEVQLCTWLSKSDVFCQKLSEFVSGGQSWNPFRQGFPTVCDLKDFHSFRTLTDMISSCDVWKNTICQLSTEEELWSIEKCFIVMMEKAELFLCERVFWTVNFSWDVSVGSSRSEISCRIVCAWLDIK